MQKGAAAAAAVIVILLVLVTGAVYTVDQTQSAIVVQLGKPVREVLDPGIHLKVPFIQQLTFFEKRILEYDSSPAEILTQDKKNLVVDNYAKWKIVDPLKFYQTVRNEYGAQSRLDDIIYAQLRVQLGLHTLTEVVSEKRHVIMENVTAKSNELAKDYGIEVVDVRVKRADLPPENEKNVYGRMNAERERQAKKYRSEGQEEAQKIRALADREKTIILAEAYKKAEESKGEGDALATKIYADAYQQDPQFFSFIRSIEAYKKRARSFSHPILTFCSSYKRVIESGY
jgi:membrane protease subunit HflC